jgi:hypothetical protein
MIKKFGGAILGVALVFGVIGATDLTAQAQYQRNDRWDRNREWRRDDNDRDWRKNKNRRNERLHGRGYNNGRYGYPGNNNGRYGNGRYGTNGGYNNTNSYELNRGYQQGLSTGSSDARRGQSYNPQRSRYYRNPSSYEFRQGFVRGYDQGYRQYSGYNNNGYYRSNNGSVWSQILGLPFQ